MAEPDTRPPWERFGGSRDRSVFPEVNDPSGGNRPPWERFGANAPHLHTELPESERPLGESEFQRRHPNRMDRIWGGVTNIYQGVPILGGRAGETDASRDFGRTYPLTSGVGRFLAGVAAYAPQSRAMQGASTVAANLIRGLFGASQRSTPGLVSNTLGQGILGGFTNAADTAVRREAAGQTFNPDDLVIPGVVGFGAGALGPLGSRLLAPSGVGNRVRYDPRITPPIIHDLQDAPLINSLTRDPRFRTAFINDLRDAAGRGRLGPGNRPPRLDRAMRFINAERGRRLAGSTGDVIGNVIAPLAGATLGGLGSGGNLMGALYGALGGSSLNVLARAAARSPTGQRYLGRTMPSERQMLIDSLTPSAITQVPIQERQ